MSWIKYTTTFLMFVALPSFALVCPDKKNAPLCPTSGSTLLDDTYPTQAFVISNQGKTDTKDSVQTAGRFIEKIIKSYDYNDIPQIILPVTNQEDFAAIVESIKNKLSEQKISPESISKIIGQITYSNLPSYTWQQDWFESFVDLKTGAPKIRQIESYLVPKDPLRPLTLESHKEITKPAAICGVESGESLVADFLSDDSDDFEAGQSFANGEMGGNIEGAPGGLCLIGDNLSKKFAKQFCGDEKNLVQLQTSWLSVGHVDEIFKVIPTHYRDGRPKECQFALMAASPKKALDLMKKNQATSSPFINLRIKEYGRDENEMRKSRGDLTERSNLKICDYITKLLQQAPKNDKSTPKNRSVFLKLLKLSTSKAMAFDEDTYMAEACAKNIDAFSNADIKKMIEEDEATYNLNAAVEESIAKDMVLIKEKILGRLPQCAPFYDEFKVPNLFRGMKAKKDPKTGKLKLMKAGTADSFLPNPTNAVVMNKTLVIPDSENDAFNADVSRELTKRGLKADFIPTWDYAHVGNGNIHCASHSMTYCKPRDK